jgi:hypothetical protein
MSAKWYFRSDKSSRRTEMRNRMTEAAAIDMKLAHTISARPMDSPRVRHTRDDGYRLAKRSSSGEQMYPLG